MATMHMFLVVLGLASPQAPQVTPVVHHEMIVHTTTTHAASRSFRRPPPTTTTTVVKHPKPTTTTSFTQVTEVEQTLAPISHHESGVASWLHYGHNICAHKTIPKGTIVTVHRLGTNKSITCRVADRGPYVGGRIIDLDQNDFAGLANPGTGTIPVEISW